MKLEQGDRKIGGALFFLYARTFVEKHVQMFVSDIPQCGPKPLDARRSHEAGMIVFLYPASLAVSEELECSTPHEHLC
jgi:hypothetical protein